MSASDAAPLPRLGEVFFDVRGSSRSMRLSWYADTGVAVFSIWQGGMCTGTFRLPIGDLPRMVEILQRGPDGRGLGGAEHGADRERPGGAYSDQQDYPTGSVLGPGPDGYSGDPRSGYGREDTTRPRQGEYGREEPAELRQAGYGRDETGLASRAAYGRDELAEARQAGRFGRDEFAEPGGGGYGRDAFSAEPYPGYRTEHPADTGYGGHGRDDGGDTMAAGYGQERFVPPYVRGPADDYGNDIPGRAADMPTGSRHGAYRDEGQAGRSGPEEYQEPQWAPGDYSDEPRYRKHAGYEPVEPEQADPGAWR